MAGTEHKRLVQLLITRARGLGYSVVASDQGYAILGSLETPIPPVLHRHRPDVLGIKLTHPRIFIGEAKTPGDLNGKRTREQLADFSSLADTMFCIAIPASAESSLRRALSREGVEWGESMECMAVPDGLLEG